MFERTRALLLALVLPGCGNMELDEFTAGKPDLVLEDFFSGQTRAWGLFEDRFGRVRRQFTVDIEGTFDGEQLTLVEDFTYADGEEDRRIWRIKPLGDGRYEGRADDVVGSALGRAAGNALHWEYEVNLDIGERTWQVHFDDWMFLQAGDVLINRATVSKFGFTLGEVTLFFRKL